MSFTQRSDKGLIYMTDDKITAAHAFTTRYGGVSSGACSSLNLGINRGDDAENVRKNYDIICSALGVSPERLLLSRQVHGDGIRAVSSADCRRDLFDDIPYEADGLITTEKNLPLFIFTADCIPILLHDPVLPAAGAVHAGWRGTVLDIAGRAVREMTDKFGSRPENIMAAIGPGISACCFETDGDVPEAVRKLLGSRAGEFIKESGGGKYKVDLKGVNRLCLESAGVLPENISISPECTVCKSEKYWSNRVTGGSRGSQAAIITL